nr:MAG TPA: hypothetical protein [Caudoviricetes sp.]
MSHALPHMYCLFRQYTYENTCNHLSFSYLKNIYFF